MEEKKAEQEKQDIVLEAKKEEIRKPSFLEVLGRLSPGKSLRTALDNILPGRTGALIVFDCKGLKDICEGGFRVNCRFTPQKLSELAKMDGAIILSSDSKRILHANVLLVPDTRIPSNETGTRHMAAERTAKQTGTPVIAVSERRGNVTLFYEDKKYVLQDAESLLRRATETLRILEKQKEISDDIMTNLNVLEMTNLVSVGDVCSVLQRIEIIIKMMNSMKRYLIELGKEGLIIKMRIRELFKGIEEEEDLVLRDYTHRPNNVKKLLSNISFDSLLNTESLARTIFGLSQDENIYPKGHRILEKLNLTEREIKSFVSSFENLGEILNAEDRELETILKQKTASFKKEFENLKEQIMVGKKV